VWEVLSVHSTPHKRDAALGALKRARALTPDSMARRAEARGKRRARGPYLEQREALKTGVDIFRRAPALPAVIRGLPSFETLKGLPQMGEGGAYRMLLFAAGHPVFPVDARVSRVARRLGYGDGQTGFAKAARSIRAAVSADLPGTAGAYGRAFVYLNHHGAATCTEADPHCRICPLLHECPEGKRRYP
jgi:endonuclease-3